MKSIYITLFATAFCTSITIGCDNSNIEITDVDESEITEPLVSPKDQSVMNRYKFSHLHLSENEVNDRVLKLASAMAPDSSFSYPSVKIADDESIKEDGGDMVYSIPFKGVNGIRVGYDSSNSLLRINNMSLLTTRFEDHKSFERNPEGIGEKKAIEKMVECLDRLDDNKLLDKSNYDLNKVHVTYVRTGRGSRGEPEGKHEWIEEYQFAMNRQLDGIPVYGAFARIGVFRDGQISSINVADVEIERIQEILKVRTVDDYDIMKKFQSKYINNSDYEITNDEIAYFFPKGADSMELEPMKIISYSPTFESEGHKFISRPLTVGHSLTDKDAPFIDFSPE